MLAEIGIVATFLAFLACFVAIVLSVYGERIQSETLVISGRNAALTTFPLMLLSCSVLVIALLNQNYQIQYVWSVSDPETPAIFRFTALWGSQQGSLLFWSMLMSLFSVGAIIFNWKSERRLMPYAIAFMMASLAFFLALNLFIENPFQRIWVLPDMPENQQVVSQVLIPPDAVAPRIEGLADSAQGLNPLLRHFGMIIHPPMLYLGFVGFLIPFAFAMSALASGDLTTNWIKATRRWTLISWIFLSVGLILGGRWAYDVLGWGGYWGWDPVENAAFLPWLVGTAFLHSVMIQEKRGMLKLWNMILVITTFSAVLFGTFATRSGLIESVHAFARSEIGAPMLIFWSAMTLIAVTLTIWRWNQGKLRDEHPFVSVVSRESFFVLNNVIFMALAIAIFWGSFGAPIVSDMFFGEEITLGVDYYMKVTPPLFLAMYILMGVAPLSAWTAMSLKRLASSLYIPLILTFVSLILIVLIGTTTVPALIGYGVSLFAGYVAIYEIYRGASARHRGLGENWFKATTSLFGRNQRRYGGYIVHLGITVIGLGVIGSTLFQYETQQSLRSGMRLTAQGYQLEYDNFVRAQAVDGRTMNIANVNVFRDGKQVATLRPRIDDYGDGMTMTIAGAHSTIENDFYVLLTGADTNGEVVTFKVYINPLINLVWWGGIILIIGTVIAALPKEALPERVRQRK